jgi:hypothetical protein
VNCRDITELAPLHFSGELESPEAAAFAAHLKGCSSCSEEIERQAYFDARLRAIVLSDEADVTPIDRRVRLQIASDPMGHTPPARTVSRRWVFAAAGIAAIVLLLVGYRDLFGRHIGAVYAAAATDHRLEVVELQPRQWLFDLSRIETLAQQVGVSTPAISALSSGSYHLNRAKLCRLDGRVFLHMVFSDGTEEFSFFLRQRDSGSLADQVWETPDRKSVHESDFNSGQNVEHVASFDTGHLSVVVVTNQSASEALQIARFAAAVL